MQKWEYAVKIIGGRAVNKDAWEATLDELGSRGWELVSIVCTADSTGETENTVGVFKKRSGV
jgi:hypothetical protein